MPGAKISGFQNSQQIFIAHCWIRTGVHWPNSCGFKQQDDQLPESHNILQNPWVSCIQSTNISKGAQMSNRNSLSAPIFIHTCKTHKSNTIHTYTIDYENGLKSTSDKERPLTILCKAEMHLRVGTRWFAKSTYDPLSHGTLHHSVVAPLQILKQTRAFDTELLFFLTPSLQSPGLNWIFPALFRNLKHPSFIIKERK